MRDIIQCMSVLCKLPNNSNGIANDVDGLGHKTEVKDSSGTQTEIVAVHTPQVENLPFPFVNKMARPSTLSLTDSNDNTQKNQKVSDKDGEESIVDGDKKSIDSATTSKLNPKCESNEQN